MKRVNLAKLVVFFGAFTLFLAFSADVFGQGRGKGNSGNINRGNSDTRGGKSNDDLWDNDRNRRNSGRTNNSRRDNVNKTDNLNRYNGLSKRTGIAPEKLQSWYQSERTLNPDLTYGQFVAANMIAENRGSRYPQLTTEAILSGLRKGESLGQTLKNLGLRGSDYDREKKRVKNEIKRLKDRDDYDADYDLDW
jgi:hypothetical protein